MTKQTMTFPLHRREREETPRFGVLELAEDVFLPVRLWNGGEAIVNYYNEAKSDDDYNLHLCFSLDEAWQEVDRLLSLIRGAVRYRSTGEE